MAIQTRQVEYRDHDTLLEAYMAFDDSSHDRRPGVLISHTWAGRSESEENKAEVLAELGYVGFALDLYGKGVKGSGPEENAALMQPLLDDRILLQQRVQLALDVLGKQKEVDAARIAAMGFCFGGLCVLDLARTGADILGAASFHGLFRGLLEVIRLSAYLPMGPERFYPSLPGTSAAGAVDESREIAHNPTTAGGNGSRRQLRILVQPRRAEQLRGIPDGKFRAGSA